METSETECGVDRISSLPLPLLHHILSSLTTQSMVQTCILSKRWSNVWCSVPCLDFDERLFSNKANFVQFVHSLLFLRDGSNINKFHIYLETTTYDVEVNKWIIYAVRHNVQILDVDLFEKSKLSLHVFTSESLREFKLSDNRLDVPASIYLPALQVLHLRYVTVRDGQLDEALFSAMPSLKTFILEECRFENQEVFSISASQLENLIIKSGLPTTVEISAPNLVSFEIKPKLKLPEIVRFKSNPNLLLNASLDLGASRFESMIQLFAILRSTRSLALSSLFLSSVVVELQKDFGIAECIRTPFNNLKCLKFGTSFTHSELLGINNILEESPYLETIYLENEMGKNVCNLKAEEHFEEVKMIRLSHNLPHLKLVEVQGFQGSENEVKFVKFFLENAIVLDKLIITTSKSDSGNSQEVVKIGRKLLSCARASSSVGILFA